MLTTPLCLDAAMMLLSSFHLLMCDKDVGGGVEKTQRIENVARRRGSFRTKQPVPNVFFKQSLRALYFKRRWETAIGSNTQGGWKATDEAGSNEGISGQYGAHLASIRTLKGSVTRALTNCTCTRKHWEKNKFFHHLSSNRFCLNAALIRKSLYDAEQNKSKKANKRLLSRGERTRVWSFEWWRECEDGLCLSYTGNVVNVSETRAEIT